MLHDAEATWQGPRFISLDLRYVLGICADDPGWGAGGELPGEAPVGEVHPPTQSQSPCWGSAPPTQSISDRRNKLKKKRRNTVSIKNSTFFFTHTSFCTFMTDA